MDEIAKTSTQYDNEITRRLLRDVVELQDPAGLPELQERVRQYLDGTDRRRQRTRFFTPEIQAERDREMASRQAAFGPIMRRLQGEGASLDGIARALNEAGIPAPSGGAWAKGSVKYQLDRLPPADQD